MSPEPLPEFLEHLPDPSRLRQLIAEQVQRTQLLRQLLRLSIRRGEASGTPKTSDKREASGAR